MGPKLLYVRDTLLLGLMLRDMDAIPSGAGEGAAIQACSLPLESHLWLLFTTLKFRDVFSFFLNWTEEKSPVEKCRATMYEPPRNINVVKLDGHILSAISMFIYKFNFLDKGLLSWSWNRKSSLGRILYLFTHWNSPDFRPIQNQLIHLLETSRICMKECSLKAYSGISKRCICLYKITLSIIQATITML